MNKKVVLTVFVLVCLSTAMLSDIAVATPLPYDLNMDGKVDIQDIRVAANAFGSYPGHERWNADADINGDNKVNMKDICTVARNFGKTA